MAIFLLGGYKQVCAQGLSVTGTIDANNLTITGTILGGTYSGTLASGTLSGITTLSNLASVGTITTGVWNGTTISAAKGGTGVNNGTSTITLAGSLVTTGAFQLTLATTATTSLTLPTSGRLISSVDTASMLSNRLKISDTANMLFPYATKDVLDTIIVLTSGTSFTTPDGIKSMVVTMVGGGGGGAGGSTSNGVGSGGGGSGGYVMARIANPAASYTYSIGAAGSAGTGGGAGGGAELPRSEASQLQVVVVARPVLIQ